MHRRFGCDQQCAGEGIKIRFRTVRLSKLYLRGGIGRCSECLGGFDVFGFATLGMFLHEPGVDEADFKAVFIVEQVLRVDVVVGKPVLVQFVEGLVGPCGDLPQGAIECVLKCKGIDHPPHLLSFDPGHEGGINRDLGLRVSLARLRTKRFISCAETRWEVESSLSLLALTFT